MFEEIELWIKEKLDCLRDSLRLIHGIPSHDTFGRLLDADQVEAAAWPWSAVFCLFWMRRLSPLMSDPAVAQTS